MTPGAGSAPAPVPRLVAWEITRECNLSCAHCRASAEGRRYEGELSLAECRALIDDILRVGRPILILTGGEPLIREDFFEIAGYAAGRGLRVVVGSNGTLVTGEVAARMKSVPISRLAVSIDFPSPEMQDGFRGVQGAFKAAVAGIDRALEQGIEVQVNSTITKLNAQHLDDLVELALASGAVAFHPFLLVPTGRGKDLRDHALAAGEYERLLVRLYEKQRQLEGRLFVKPTDAPHYMRVVCQREGRSLHAGSGRPLDAMSHISRGCLAGTGFCFVSHTGRVQGCGYLDVAAGDIREQSFSHIWRHSPLFEELRDYSLIKGKCGRCEFKEVCGGCRARAYESTGDYLAEEPYCVYRPAGDRHAAGHH